MSSVIEKIIEWGTSLPYWERFALDGILSGKVFSDEDYREILQYLKEDAGIIEKSDTRPEIVFNAPKACAAGSFFTPQYLRRLYCLQNVNALAPGQEIQFDPQLTIIYGGNGSGKTGYARVLACSASARGHREILPNVLVAPGKAGKPRAIIEVIDTAGKSRSIGYEHDKGRRCVELSSFYVFDTNSLSAYLSDTNELELSPAGLDNLTQLTSVVDKVKSMFQADINAISESHGLEKHFDGESCIKEIVIRISNDTCVENIEILSVLTEREKEQKKKLEEEIAALSNLNIPNKIRALKQQKSDLSSLIQLLDDIEKKLNDSIVTGIIKLIDDYNKYKEEASKVSLDKFKWDKFRSIGTDEWYRFIESARKLGNAESQAEKNYPVEGDPCLLCRQPLSEAEITLIKSFWEFLDSAAPSKYEKADNQCKNKFSEIDKIDLEFFNDKNTARRYLDSKDDSIVSGIDEFLEAYRKRKSVILSILGKREKTKCPDAKKYPKENIELRIEAVEKEINKLESSDNAAILDSKKNEFRVFTHRELLSKYLEEIKTFITAQKWKLSAAKALPSTRHVSTKYNELFQDLVAKKLEATFTKILSTFKRDLKVKIDTRPHKGMILKRIIIERHPDFDSRPKLDSVLSEGEKRAVALTDFLTEVSMDENSKGMIFDDPITSLDKEWKKHIAEKLVDEAKTKQLIIFTHDLTFHYHLLLMAEKEDIKTQMHWIKRGTSDDVPGYVHKNNGPSCEEAYRKSTKAREYYERANMELNPQEQEDILKYGFGALRSSYEAFIIFDLFNEVYSRFSERISFGRLGEIVWDDKMVDSIIKKCEYLSTLIEGHLHSDEYCDVKPTPKLLIDEIEEFDKLKKQINQMKKVKKEKV